MKRKILISAILLIVMEVNLFSQVQVREKSSFSPGIKFKIARQLINQGENEKALEILSELISKYPGNSRYRNEYWSLLKKLRRYDELQASMAVYLKKHPADEKTRIEMGELFVLRGDTTTAEKYWADVLRSSKNPSNSYRLLFLTYYGLGMYDRMQKVAREARARLKKPDFLAFDLANFYHRTGQTVPALREYLLLLKTNPGNLKYVSQRILTFPEDSLTTTITDSLLRSEVGKHYSSLPMHRLYYEFLMRQNHVQDAYREIIIVDSLSEGNGTAIIQHVRNLLQDGMNSEAVRILIGLLKNPDFRRSYPEALMLLARAYEKNVVSSGNEQYINRFFPGNSFLRVDLVFNPPDSVRSLEPAISIYDSILHTLPNTGYAAEALMRIGEIQYRVLGDYDNAFRSFSRALDIVQKPEFALKCYQRMAEIQFVRGDIKKSLKITDEALGRFHQEAPRKQLLILKLKLLFLGGYSDSLQAKKDTLMKLFSVEDRDFNDLMEIISLTELYGYDHERFQQYLEVEKLIHRGKLSEAAELCHYVLKDSSASPAENLIRFRLCTILLQLNRYDLARETAIPLLNSDFLNLDRVIFLMGSYAREKLSDPGEMKFWYEKILLDYPTSIYIDEIREYLRLYQ